MGTDYKAILQQVMEQNPELSDEGWRYWKMTREEFEQDQIELLDNVEAFQAAYEWCARLEHRKSMAPHYGFSYGLKHICERAVGRYITNGTLIAAMLAHGFQYKVCSGGLNCIFFVTVRSVKQA